MIYIVGLGPGSIDDISMGTFELLKNSDNVYFRTKRHPLVDELAKKGVKYQSLDRFYENNSDFELVYENIAGYIRDCGKEKDIVYAVPGHPLVAEKSVNFLIEKLKKENISYKIIPAMSFLDSMFSSLEMDPSDGFILLDAFKITQNELSNKKHIIITQVYDKFIASEVKLVLQEFYKDEETITLINSAGMKEEQILCIPLGDMDKTNWDFNHLTSIYIKKDTTKKYYDIFDLLDIVKKLRSNEGCPWDKAQTKETLAPMLIDEAREVQEAIDKDDIDNLVDELGDVLLHIALQTQLGIEEDMFDFSEITQGIVNKMIRRHPHVFGDEKAKTLNDVNILWENIKKEEKNNKNKINNR